MMRPPLPHARRRSACAKRAAGCSMPARCADGVLDAGSCRRELATQPRLRPGAGRPHAGRAARLGRAAGARAGAAAGARLACAPGDGVRRRADPRLGEHRHPGRFAGHGAARARRRRLRRQSGPRRAAPRRDLARAMARHQCHRHCARRGQRRRRARRRALPRPQRVPHLRGGAGRRSDRHAARRVRHLRRPARLSPAHARSGAVRRANDRAQAVPGALRRRAATAPAPSGRRHRHRHRRPAGADRTTAGSSAPTPPRWRCWGCERAAIGAMPIDRVLALDWQSLLAGGKAGRAPQAVQRADGDVLWARFDGGRAVVAGGYTAAA